MKKILINEDWETIEVEDDSSLFVLIFKQGSDTAGYIKCYNTDDSVVLAEYAKLVDQYTNVKFEEPTSIIVIKVPATGQVQAMLEEAVYAGDETNPTKIEIINHLLGRADCEYIEEKVLMSLEEAKKKKKRKRTSKVTYLTGFPFLNDHRFNHACGTCDCGKDAADNANSEMGSDSTGEGSGDGSLGGDSAGEGGAMGESFKLKESWEEFNFEDHNSDDVVTVVIIDKRFDPLFKKDHKESLSRNNVKVEGQYFNGIVVTGKVGDIIQVCDECHVMNPNKIFMEAVAMMEAMTPLEKMRALENGTRGFNAAAAGDVKLVNYYNICTKNGLQKAAAIVEAEIQKRMNQGTWTLKNYTIPGFPQQTAASTAPTKPANNNNITSTASQTPNIQLADFDFYDAGKFYLDDMEARMLKYYVEHDNLDRFIELLEDPTNSTPQIKLSYSLAMLLFAMYFKYENAVKAIVASIVKVFGCTAAELKQYVKDVLLKDSSITSKVQKAVSDVLNEQIEKGAPMNLTEAKRYIKRYYIRPQNVFASNKAEILQRLAEVEADGANCSVYSLKALEDHDDVHLLQPKDIIYYYDEGVLYDKNHVPVLDYDLNVKNEEERPKISADATSDERFKDVYQDRMTDRTFAEALEEDFYMDFDDVNVYGVRLKEGKEAEYTCCICGDEFEGYGNNPAPYKESGKCCDACNRKFVIPARFMQLQDNED
jgi:DNA-binding protein YbaB